jgi:putative transposase
MGIEELLSQGRISRFFRSTRKLNNAQLVSHITQRAAGREPLFIEDRDYLFMLGLLKELAPRASLTLYAFCLMPNHIHLLLTPQKDNLFDAMRDLFSGYARYFNRKYERKGHLFGGPYRQSVCFDEKYLLAASIYIHVNPVRVGLVSNPFRYRWSSSRLYGDKQSPASFVDSSFILNLIADDINEAKRAYKNLMDQAAGLETGEVLEGESAIDQLLDQLRSLIPNFWKRIRFGRLKNPTDLELFDEEALSRKIEQLNQQGGRDIAESRQARKFVIEQLIARGFKRNEIAARLGVSIKTIYNYLD